MRLLREISQDMGGSGWRFKPETIEALQVACEDYIFELSDNTNLCAIHENNVVVTPKDMKLAVTPPCDAENIRAKISFKNHV